MLTHLKRNFRTTATLISVGVLTLTFSATAVQAQTEVLRVDITNGSTTGDGSNWGTDAFKFLQDALDDAEDLIDSELADEVHIWVAEGTYRPDQRAAVGDCDPPGPNCCPPFGDCDREHSFELRNNVILLGGFPPDTADTQKYGPNGATLEHRDHLNNPTILCGTLAPNNHAHITLRAAPGTDGSAAIDGFTIHNAINPAFIAEDARLRVFNCVFASSSSTRAAVHLLGESEIVFIRCQFENAASIEPIDADVEATFHCWNP